MAAKIVTQTMIATALGALLLSAASIPSAAQAPKRPANGYALKEPTTPEEIAAAKPNPQTPGFRVPLPPLDQMDPALRADYEFNSKRLKTPVPPTAPLMLTPEIKNSVSGPVLGPVGEEPWLPERPPQILSFCVVARHWGAQFEWWVHAPQAVIVGVPADAMEALRTGKVPKFANDGQDATYHYLVELLRDHKVSDATFERLRGILGTQRVIAVTTLAGYYDGLAMTLIATNLPLRADQKPPLPLLAKTFP